MSGERSHLRKQIDAERQEFIDQWCVARGLDSRLAENYDQAALAWAVENSPPSTSFVLSPAAEHSDEDKLHVWKDGKWVPIEAKDGHEHENQKDHP